MAAADAANNLSEEFESFFFGAKIGEREAGVGLDDAYGGKVREIEATGDSLGANEDFDVSRFNFVIKRVQRFAFFVVSIKAGDFDVGEEFGEFTFEEFGAKTFMKDRGVVAVRTRGGDFF